MVKSQFHWRHSAAASLLAGLIALVPAPARTAMISDFISTIPLTSRTDIVLPFEADMALVLPDGRLLLAMTRRPGTDAGGRLIAYDPQTNRQSEEIDLPHDISLVQINSAGGFIYAAGNQGELFHITRANLQNRNLSTHIQAGAIARPALAISDDGTVFLGHRDTNAVSIILPERFLPPERAKAEFAANGDGYGLGLRYSGPGNVYSLGASSDAGILFVSDTNEARLSAVDVKGKQVIVDQLGYADAKDPQSIPLVVQAQTQAASFSQAGPGMALIAADARRSRLLLVDYNPSFQTLDPVSEVGFRLSAPPLPDDKTGSPLLVDASSSQSVIVLASRTGRGLRVYGRNGSSIEAGPEFADLPESPLSLDVSADGRMAALMLSDRKTVSLLREDSTVTIENQAEAIRALQRQLTELGYPIGVVDGILGNKTNRALQHALQQPDGTPTLPFDLNAMTEAQILDLTNRLKAAPNIQQLR